MYEMSAQYVRMYIQIAFAYISTYVCTYTGGVRMKYPSHGVLVMGCLEEDEVCDVTKRSCIKEDSHDVLQRWTSYHQYDSTQYVLLSL